VFFSEDSVQGPALWVMQLGFCNAD